MQSSTFLICKIFIYINFIYSIVPEHRIVNIYVKILYIYSFPNKNTGFQLTHEPESHTLSVVSFLYADIKFFPIHKSQVSEIYFYDTPV